MSDATSPPATPSPPAPPFDVIIRPHRSLGRTGFLVLMAAVSLVSFVAGLAFLLIGAWPVMGFLGLDVVLIYVAFRLNYRAGRAYERLQLAPDTLRLTRVEASGRAESVDFNPYWVRVRLDEGADGRSTLALTLHGRAWPIGRALADDERRSLAAAIDGALAAAGRS